MKSKKIIVAVSLDGETHNALMKLKEVDIGHDTEVHFVNIVPVVLYARGMQFSLLTYPLPQERPAIEESVIDKLKGLKGEILPHHGKVVYKCIFDPNEKAAFNDYVLSEQADLVVVATRKKHGLFDSSFAQHLLKHSPGNVLILK
ncbi:MAG TPA: universal stress protein [Bacteriovoracaceae bacterium]|nr:universal stress protein [Bacteriovoracaceae bacterium]